MPPDKPPREMPPEASSPTPKPPPPDEEVACSLSQGGDEETCTLPAEAALPLGDDTKQPAASNADRRASRLAALIYLGISLTAAAVFIVVTTFVGSYPPVARYGGAAWVFILLMIVLMPLVIPRVKKWVTRTAPARH